MVLRASEGPCPWLLQGITGWSISRSDIQPRKLQVHFFVHMPMALFSHDL